ncbi:MAG: type II toxin-antitoxin system VapC family toxin [Cyanobacteria bacterium P01_F01_bin.4]
MMAMLDTNICIYILKNHPAHLRDKLKAAETLSISAVVYAELCVGVELSPAHLQTPRREQLQQFINLLEIAGWDSLAAEHYASIRADLKQKGMPIGNMDLLIAAHARSLDQVLVTNNAREFERVDGLQLENWTKDE